MGSVSSKLAAALALGGVVRTVSGSTLAATTTAVLGFGAAYLFIPASRPPPLDYTNSDNWYHIAGRKNGGCEHVPDEATPNSEESGQCDCFYIHGTNILTGGNAPIGAAACSKELSYESMLRRESTPFNGCCKMYAPGYRQVTMTVWFQNAFGLRCQSAFDIAEADVMDAFQEFLRSHCTEDRPFILAGHSQGGHMVRYLLQNCVDKDPALRARMVCAYAAGVQVGHDSFKNIPIATGELDTCCVVSWATTDEQLNPKRKSGAAPARVNGVTYTKQPVSVNPLNWSTTLEVVPADRHLGCLGMDGNMTEMKVACRCSSTGVLLCTGNVPSGYVNSDPYDYHEGDIPCFWANIRLNARNRVEAWFESQRSGFKERS